MNSAFSGIRVLDVSRVLAGPYCGQMLADFGADVVKIESVGGDENRKWEPLVDGRSTNFISVNRGKRSLTLNLKSTEGQDILARLIRDSDVLIDSFLPETAASLGLDHAAVSKLNPSIVHASITGYGGQGPLKNRPGYDLTLQAFTGMMSITGEPGGPPMRAGASVIDMATGMLAFSGVSAALFARAQGISQGQHIEVSLLETGIALLGYHVTAYTMAGKKPSKEGSGVWHLVPYQAFPTADGWVLAGATNDASWIRMCKALHAPHLENDVELNHAEGRIRRRDYVVEELSKLFSQRSTSAWMDVLESAKLPCSPINDIETLAAHPQVRATEMLVEAKDPTGTPHSLCGVPIKMSGTAAQPGSFPPDLGQHTFEILQERLGMDKAAVERLKSAGVI